MIRHCDRPIHRRDCRRSKKLLPPPTDDRMQVSLKAGPCEILPPPRAGWDRFWEDPSPHTGQGGSFGNLPECVRKEHSS